MAQAIFPALTPGPAFDDTDGIEVASSFFVTTAKTVTGVYFYASEAHAATVTLYQSGVAPVAARKSATLTAGLNIVTFDAPVTLTANTTYLAAVHQAAPCKYTSIVQTPRVIDGDFQSGNINPDTDERPGRFRLSSTPAVAPVALGSGFTTAAGYLGVGVVYDDGTVAPPSNAAPSASAGVDQAVTVGTAVTLNGSGSDSDGTIAAYAWTRTGGTGPAVTLAGSGATRTFTPTAAGTYTFGLTVTDDDSATSTADSVTITVTAVPAPDPEPDPTPTVAGWNALYAKVGSDQGPTTLLGYLHDGIPTDSGSGLGRPWEIDVREFNGPGVTDQQRIQAAIDAAVVAAPEHNYNVAVLFESREYDIAAPPNVDEYSYAQLHIPNVPASSSPKVHLALRGAGDAAGLLYWAQNRRHSVGTVLRCTLGTDPASDSTYGIPAVLAGPMNLFPATGAPQDDIATFSNMHVTLSGIQVSLPHHRRIGGINLQRVAQMHVDSASVFSEGTRLGNPSIQTLPAHDDQYGLWTPEQGNNAVNTIRSFTAEGLSTGIYGMEHLTAQYIAIIYARYGLIMRGDGNGQQWPDGSQRQITHNTAITNLLCEAVEHWLVNSNSTTQIVATMSGEGITRFLDHVSDPLNLLTGELRLHDIYQQVPVVNGGNRLRIVTDQVTRGAKSSPPAVPASTTELRNPYWRDASVYVAGGTVSAIRVDGVATGMTSGLVRVPTGKSIAVTYSAAPTWQWVLD